MWEIIAQITKITVAYNVRNVFCLTQIYKYNDTNRDKLSGSIKDSFLFGGVLIFNRTDRTPKTEKLSDGDVSKNNKAYSIVDDIYLKIHTHTKKYK